MPPSTPSTGRPSIALSEGTSLSSQTPSTTHERWFLAFLVLLPCMAYLGLWVLGSYVYLADALFVVVALAWLVARVRRRAALARGWIHWPLGMYFAACVASAAFSADRSTSFQKLLLEVYVLSLCLVTYHVVRSRAVLRKALLAWTIGTLITALAGTAEVIAYYAGPPQQPNYGSLPAGDYTRVTGLFLNFNMACNYLSVGLLIALAAWRLRWLRESWFRLLLALIAVAAVFTLSPGLGGIALGLGLWLWVNWRASHPSWARLALLAGCIGAGAMFVATLVSPTQLAHEGIAGAIRRHDLQPSSRLLCWEAALSTVREHPLLGEGTGLPMPCPAYLHVSGEIIHLQDAHNSFLNIAALKGLAGLAAFLAIAIWLLARAGRWSLDSPDNIVVTTLAIAFVEAFLYQGLSSSFEHTRHLWVLAGLLAAAIEVRRSPSAGS